MTFLDFSCCHNVIMMYNTWLVALYCQGVRLCNVQATCCKQLNTVRVQSISLSLIEENQKMISFHHQCQACWIHYFYHGQVPLSKHEPHCRIWLRFWYFIQKMRPTEARRNVPSHVSILTYMNECLCLLHLCSTYIRHSSDKLTNNC